MPPSINPIPLLVASAFLGITCGVTLGEDSSPDFKITTQRKTDNVAVEVEKDKTVFTVSSPFGISQSVIKRMEEKWPDAVVLRLRLDGLESFRVSNGKVTINAAVSSNDNKQRVRVWKNSQEGSPLDSGSPYWMEIGMIGGDGQKAQRIPLKKGYFEMQLPKAIFDGNPKSLTVNWIDFYRN